MLVRTLFGEREIAPNNIYNIRNGLIGFPNITDYAIVNVGSRRVQLFQSLDIETVALCVIGPEIIDENRRSSYLSYIGRQAQTNGITGNSQTPQVWLVLNRQNGHYAVDLKGPIVINPESREGEQLICSRFQLRQHVDLPQEPTLEAFFQPASGTLEDIEPL